MRFAGSDLIGGADADLLVDGLLLDFKSTHAATAVNKSDVFSSPATPCSTSMTRTASNESGSAGRDTV